MEVTDVLHLQELLAEKSIDVCILGEVALNYYNVPRVIHDLELCVPEKQLSHAVSLILYDNDRYMLWPWARGSLNYFTEYKSPFPRFKANREGSFYFTVYPATFFDLEPLKPQVIPSHSHSNAEYTTQLSDLCPSIDVLASLKLPRLGPFFKGLIRKYCATHNYNFAMMAEQLVDGMDLDEAWCRDHLATATDEELEFALRLVDGKMSRLDYMWPDRVTCYINNEEEAKRIRGIPGRD